MGTFSSETAAKKNNSGKLETLNALENDPIWLLLHSWFSKKFPWEDPQTPPPPPPHPPQEVHMDKLQFFSNNTSAPRLKLCYNDTNQIANFLKLWFCDLWFIYL